MLFLCRNVAIVLAAFDMRLDVLWWHRANGVAESGELPRPVVRAAALLHRDDRGRELAEVRDHLRTAA